MGMPRQRLGGRLPNSRRRGDCALPMRRRLPLLLLLWLRLLAVVAGATVGVVAPAPALASAATATGTAAAVAAAAVAAAAAASVAGRLPPTAGRQLVPPTITRPCVGSPTVVRRTCPCHLRWVLVGGAPAGAPPPDASWSITLAPVRAAGESPARLAARAAALRGLSRRGVCWTSGCHPFRRARRPPTLCPSRWGWSTGPPRRRAQVELPIPSCRRRARRKWSLAWRGGAPLDRLRVGRPCLCASSPLHRHARCVALTRRATAGGARGAAWCSQWPGCRPPSLPLPPSPPPPPPPNKQAPPGGDAPPSLPSPGRRLKVMRWG